MKLFLFLLLSCITFLSIGQSLKVTDQEGRPIDNVMIYGDEFTSYTDSTGLIQYFPENGSSMLVFIHPNYKRNKLTWSQLVKSNFVITLEQRNLELEEVTIHPFKRAQLLLTIPQQVEAITPDDALLFQPQTTADLLAESNEVYLQKSQMGGGSPMIRGFSANRILLVVDGVRMNNAIFRGGNLHNVISLDASSLEQTEIILGPGSVIYGSDALGGVIHFYTLKPRLSTSDIKAPTTLMMRTSSANFEKTGHANFNLAGKKWASLTSISFSDYDDLRMGSWQHNDYQRKEYVSSQNGMDEITRNQHPNKQLFSGYSQFNAIQKIRFRPSESADIEYAFHFSKTTDIPRYDRLTQYSNDQLKYASWYYGPQQWQMHVLKGEFNLKSQLATNLSVTSAYQDYTESRHNRILNAESQKNRIENVAAYSLNIDADKYFSKTQFLYYGIEGVYNKIHSNAYESTLAAAFTSPITTRYPDGSEWWSLSSYVMYSQMLSASTSLQAGVRYSFTGMNGKFNNQLFNFPFDDFSASNGAVSVNFGMVFTPTDAFTFNVNASTGFRSPNIDDVAKVFDSEPGNVIVPNPGLDPEYASSFEAGITYKQDNFQLQATLFYTRLYNAMVRRDGQLNGRDSIFYDGQLSKIQMLTNTSWANIGGISAQAKYIFSSNLKLKGGINWQYGKDSDALPVRHIPPLFGNLHIEYFNKSIRLDLYTLFNGQIAHENLAVDERSKPHMYALNENGLPYSPAWWTLNLKSSYQISELITLSAGIENLLDVRYRPYSSGIVAPGTNAILSVNIRI